MMIVIVWILSKWTKMMTKTINSLFYPLISVTFFPIQNTLESSWNFPLLINISLCSHSRRNPAVISQDVSSKITWHTPLAIHWQTFVFPHGLFHHNTHNHTWNCTCWRNWKDVDCQWNVNCVNEKKNLYCYIRVWEIYSTLILYDIKKTKRIDNYWNSERKSHTIF